MRIVERNGERGALHLLQGFHVIAPVVSVFNDTVDDALQPAASTVTAHTTTRTARTRIPRP